MLKHVSISPWRGRADSVSLSSSGGASSCGSGSPTPGHTPPPSRASSCASLAPLTALSSFSPADTAPQQDNELGLIYMRSNFMFRYAFSPTFRPVLALAISGAVGRASGFFYNSTVRCWANPIS
ncbi:Uncharacterized protein DBV15_06276 [Temnothorax longispinosus]|uniref:Uncharacterized protein n=1 Tax=Temnothorax longispinosus TaxID=300112 RepID=A0A4S2KEC7_9HYME|nr:Uncharacterized protein DBV15_06276 [Temnothorax longispinosus]